MKVYAQSQTLCQETRVPGTKTLTAYNYYRKIVFATPVGLLSDHFVEYQHNTDVQIILK